MSFWTAFWIAIIEGVVCWVAIKLGHRNIAVLVGMVAISAVVVPMAVISLKGYAAITSANGTEEMNRAAAATVDNLVTWFSKNIESILASDFAGMVLGGVLSIFK